MPFRTLPILVLIACGPGQTGSVDTGDDSGRSDETPSPDTHTDDPPLPQVTGAAFGAAVLVDESGLTLTRGTLNGAEFVSHFWIQWGTEAYWSGESDTEACAVIVWLDGQSMTLTPDSEHPVELTVPNLSSVSTDCPDSGLGFDLPGTAVAAGDSYGVERAWRFGLGGALSKAVWNWLPPESADDAPWMLGARVDSVMVSGGGSSNIFGRAYELSSDGEVLPLPVAAESVLREDGQGLVRGAYEIVSPWYINVGG